MLRAKWFASISLAASLSGCGDAGTTGDNGEVADQAAREQELGRLSEALGEPSCGSTAPDATLNPNSGQSVFSADGNYDHPTCRNGFVVDIPGARAGRQLTGGPPVMQWPDPFSCLFVWGYASLWQKQAAGYVKIAESSRLGVWGGLPQVGYVCAAPVSLRAPADGDYKLVTASGLLFGPYGRVQVY